MLRRAKNFLRKRKAVTSAKKFLRDNYNKRKGVFARKKRSGSRLGLVDGVGVVAFAGLGAGYYIARRQQNKKRKESTPLG